MTDVESFLTLNMVEGLGPSRLKALLEHFGSPENVLRANERELEKVSNIGGVISQNIVNAKTRIDLRRELQLIEQNRAKVITIFDEAYPKNLKEIFDPPILLYVKGELSAGDFASIAIVGSRRSSYYGLQTTEKLAQDLAERGIVIVSGLARGVDTAAHRGALRCRGRTIAVLGSGLGVIYPSENARLAEEIAGSGALISEFPIEMQPYRENFPRRNRVISGLSLGVVVVEAAQKSGALITARFALEQGREVFAVPGKVDSFTSRGTHSLIKDGAKLVESSEDIIEELAPILEGYLREVEPEAAKGVSLEPKLEGEERLIYDSLSSEPKHIDELASACGLPVGRAVSALMRLQIKRLVKELPGKMFVRAK